MPRANLIFDVGLHDGEDTDFYLRKGFDVVAVEANPALGAQCEERFADAIRSGQLTIVKKAVAESEGAIDFYVNVRTAWGTASHAWMLRNAKRGAPSHVISVPATTMPDLLRDYGVPYYLKIDIEGLDRLCVAALVGLADRPAYVSIESHAYLYEETLQDLMLLAAAGYTAFQIVSQEGVPQQACPKPAREGATIDYVFPRGSTGLFGQELQGRWLTLEQAQAEYQRLYWNVRMVGPHNGVFRKLTHLPTRTALRRLFQGGADWFDTHARA